AAVSAARCLFPLGFGRQSRAAEATVSHRLVARQTARRHAGSAAIPFTRRPGALTGEHAARVGFLSHFGLVDGKSTQRDRVPRPLVGLALFVYRLVAPHHEIAGGNVDHLAGIAAVAREWRGP